MNYKVIIMYDKEYEGYVVDVPELNGCISQGKTIDKALANVKDAIAGWLLVEKKHNRLEFNEIKEMFVGEVAL
ncbi:MAG: type II toxin-antitoxin system HicB family antitoxin [Bacteroidetes bacterium]|nr:type II toxin-antitoxin system HicB family antitoxin [Bacteroidota bacterium]MBU1115306.1 type II toxin-antitoxin system HicB family antitoxin [Bacteroidota bacterium]MBU1798774.1 type II toxin-antitoxin system HicB family antitoxin [Bacteroidota bacterium]